MPAVDGVLAFNYPRTALRKWYPSVCCGNTSGNSKRNNRPLNLHFNSQALAQERLEGYRLHVEQAREEIEALQVGPLITSVHAFYQTDRVHFRWFGFSEHPDKL